MSDVGDGSRSRTGCLTCRIRKKKCDEDRQKGSCKTCYDRRLTCYGYSSPLPTWYTTAGNWKDVVASDEARQLRAIAETRYKVRRKLGVKASSVVASDEIVGPLSTAHDLLQVNGSSPSTILPAVSYLSATNTWQLYPGTVWWDRRMSHLSTDPRSPSDQDTKLLMQFLNVIHPITHTFFQLKSSRDRNWLLTYLTGDRAVYSAALSVSACFEHSLTQSPRLNDIGICPQVRDLQSVAIHELQRKIAAFPETDMTVVEDYICSGMRMLDVVLQLINLEVFSMLQGAWEIHLQAGRVLLNQLETRAAARYKSILTETIRPITRVLQTLGDGDVRESNLAYSMANFVWMDIVATATFGLKQKEIVTFDYLGLLQASFVDMSYIMGCQNWILAEIVQIIRLEQWLMLRLNSQEFADAHVFARSEADEINLRLRSGVINSDEHQDLALQENIRLLSTIWLLMARILIQHLILNQLVPDQDLDQDLVNECLQKIENLPYHLVLRVNLPFTISGCMSISDQQHHRFRWVIGKIMQAAQAPGLTWKGLLVMEECWSLRRSRQDTSIGWREAMQSMNARVLLL